MSYALHNNAGAGGFALDLIWTIAVRAPAKLFAAIAEQRRVSRTMAALEDLSDRTLDDIGISRDEIGHIARHGRDAIRL